MSFTLNLPPQTQFLFGGVPYAFQQVIDGGLVLIGKNGTLRIPDEVNGGFTLPDEAWFMQMLREGAIEFIEPMTGSAIRRVARAQEYSADEILKEDPAAAVMHFVCTEADAQNTKRGNKAIGKLLASLWSNPEVREKYGETPPKAATVRHWLKHRGTPGDRRFPDFRRMNGLGGDGNQTAEGRRMVGECALKYYTNRGRKISDVHAEVAYRFAELNKTRGPNEQIAVPSYETVRRAVHALGRRTTIAAKYGARFERSRWMGAGKPLVASRLLEIALFDHTPVPAVFCIDAEHGVVAGQPHLAIMIDLYTRCILYSELTFRDPTQGSIGRALLGANTPKQPPAFYADRYPGLAKVCGRPTVVYFDNALYQTARGVEDAFADAGVGVYYVGVDEPTQKAVVERVIQTFQTLLWEKLPGATYDIPGMREAGYDPAKHAVLTIAQARALLQEAIAYYHINPHTGLNDRAPLLVWEKSANEHGINLITRTKQLRAAIGTAVFDRTLGKDGLELHGLRYADRQIVPDLLDDLFYLEARRGRTKSPTVKVKVKYDDLDLGSVEVWNERTKSYVTLPCDDPEYARGMPLWLHEEVRKAAQAEALAFNTPAERLAARHHFNTMIAEIAPEAAEAEARLLAKVHDDPKLREIIAGRILVQEVEPSPSGMESVVPQAMAAKDRADSTHRAPRPARSSRSNGDRRDAGARPAADTRSTAGTGRDRRDASPDKGRPAPSAKPKRSLAWS